MRKLEGGIRNGLGGLILALMLAAPVMAESSCIVSIMTTCAGLSSNRYPGDSVNWFYPAQHPQIVFFAHLLFPLRPEQEDKVQSAEDPGQSWHPPLSTDGEAPKTPAGGMIAVNDQHYAEAVWYAPDNTVIADYGQTLPARVSSDYLQLQGHNYIPHTFAMAIGTRDIRAAAGQRALPAAKGSYPIRLFVDTRLVGITFFSIMEPGNTIPTPSKLGYQERNSTSPRPASPSASATAEAVINQTGKDLWQMMKPSTEAPSDLPPLPAPPPKINE
jgi:hypothetical protein